MGLTRSQLYRAIRLHPEIKKKSVKEKNLYIASLYGTNQIAMLTLEQMNDLHQRLTSTSEPTDEQLSRFVPVPEALKKSL